MKHLNKNVNGMSLSRIGLGAMNIGEKGVTVSQLAIAWVLAQGEDIMALVGSRTVNQLHDTVQAIDISLDEEDLKRIIQIVPEQYASNSAMLPLDMDENGIFKFGK